jgi:hypothetical protein
MPERVNLKCKTSSTGFIMKNMEMKYVCWIALCFCSVMGYGQNDTTYDAGSVERLDRMGKAYISEIKKIGNISYGGDINLNVNIRKERSFINNSVAKDVYFSGTNTAGACEGFIEASEVGDAISALVYINDSLLTTTPGNEMHFAKRFSNSSFVIYASFTPGAGKILSRGVWDITLTLDERDNIANQGLVYIKRSDFVTLINILRSGKEKLKTF